MTDEQLETKEHYERIRQLLKDSGEFIDSELDDQTLYILNHRFYFPEYFWTLSPALSGAIFFVK